MTKMLTKTLMALAVAGLFATNTLASELDALQGKWTAQRETNSETVKYVLEIKNDAFQFELLGEDGQLRLFAKGKVKAEKLGTFKTIKLFEIQAGSSSADLQPYDDDRTSIYVLGYGTMTIASNFDKQRNEEPSLVVYSKVTK